MFTVAYRMSIFGDYRNYNATTSNIVEFSSSFQKEKLELLPTVLYSQTITFDQSGNNPVKSDEQRIQFNSVSDGISVKILPDRIDFEAPIENTSDFLGYSKVKLHLFYPIMKAVLSVTQKAVKGYRLAHYVDILFPEKDDQSIQGFLCSHIFNLEDDSGDMYSEWEQRFNKPTKVSFGKSIEKCNTIFSLSFATVDLIENDTGNKMQKRGIRLTSDINTVADNSVPRFSCSDLKSFCNEAQQLMNKRYDRALNLISSVVE